MKPARLDKNTKENMNPILLNPAAIILAGIIIMVILAALVFAVTGHAAVESGGLRNFLATGVW